MGLIGDLFPALEVPRKQDVEFEESVKKATSDLRLQADKKFILKVVQLEELFAVRHSVFVIGFTGKLTIFLCLSSMIIANKYL